MSEANPAKPPRSTAEPGLPQPGPDSNGAVTAGTPAKHRMGIRGLFRRMKAAGHDVLSVTLGKLIEPTREPNEIESAESFLAGPDEKTDRRISVLHAAAERLRGAADNYIAAKLDEIEARVDAKLDHVETRIDAKMAELHHQLREMRDRELRHRLRLLKITLIFTVLVAVLSLGYKWLAKYVVG